MNSVYVNVLGKNGIGKSTIAKIIADALASAGITHEVDDGNDGDYGKYQADKLHALSKRPGFLVKIKTDTLLK